LSDTSSACSRPFCRCQASTRGPSSGGRCFNIARAAGPSSARLSESGGAGSRSAGSGAQSCLLIAHARTAAQSSVAAHLLQSFWLLSELWACAAELSKPVFLNTTFCEWKKLVAVGEQRNCSLCFSTQHSVSERNYWRTESSAIAATAEALQTANQGSGKGSRSSSSSSSSSSRRQCASSSS